MNRSHFAQAVLEGAIDLFCSVDCENAYSIKSSGGALRRALFRLERGRCRLCKLDCHELVTRLRCAAASCALHCLVVRFTSGARSTYVL
jgi:hypothetical protein